MYPYYSKFQVQDDLGNDNYFSSILKRTHTTPEAYALLELIKNNSIFGWGTDQECLLQYGLGRWGCKEGLILEIGSFKGRSTICFAKGVQDGQRERVVAVDPHTGAPPWFPAIPSSFTLTEFENNLNIANVHQNVTTLVTNSFQAAKIWPALPIRILFLDGDHSFEGLLADYEQWIEKLVVGGTILIDDVDEFVHLPGIQRFVESVITEEAFSEITIIDGILAATKKDLGFLGHLQHLKNCFKPSSCYLPLWDERLEREKALQKAQTLASTGISFATVESGVEKKLSAFEYELIQNFYVYSASQGVNAVLVGQDTTEVRVILKDATQFVIEGQIQEIKVCENDWVAKIENISKYSVCPPIRLLYLDLPDYNNLGYILDLWRSKLTPHSVVIVRNICESNIFNIKQELQTPPLRGMGSSENIYWAISMESDDKIIHRFQKENTILNSITIQLNAEIAEINKVCATLNEEISTFKKSNFWKLREVWLSVKNLFSGTAN
ncbi:class I SAM-dependent methyltransferase [Nostoc sp.]